MYLDSLSLFYCLRRHFLVNYFTDFCSPLLCKNTVNVCFVCHFFFVETIKNVSFRPLLCSFVLTPGMSLSVVGYNFRRQVHLSLQQWAHALDWRHKLDGRWPCRRRTSPNAWAELFLVAGAKLAAALRSPGRGLSCPLKLYLTIALF